MEIKKGDKLYLVLNAGTMKEADKILVTETDLNSALVVCDGGPRFVFVIEVGECWEFPNTAFNDEDL